MLYLSPISARISYRSHRYFATNRGMCTVRGTDGNVAPHGNSLRLTNKLFFKARKQHFLNNVMNLVQICGSVTYTWCTAKVNIRSSITHEDIKEIGGLFLDAKSSAKILMQDKEST